MKKHYYFDCGWFGFRTIPSQFIGIHIFGMRLTCSTSALSALFAVK
jgi:hypothetical protein